MLNPLTADCIAQVFLVPFNDNKAKALQRARFTDDGVLEVRTGECSRCAPGLAC